jgi:hypothetical protein
LQLSVTGQRTRFLGLRGYSLAVAAAGMFSEAGAVPDVPISQISSGSGSACAFPLQQNELFAANSRKIFFFYA